MHIRIGRHDESSVADHRGREARTPSDIPGRGWKDILLRVKEQVSTDNLFLVAAGVAFYGVLAIFPALAAMVSSLGLIMDPANVERYVAAASGALPPDALRLLQDQAHELASTSSRTLGWSLAISVGLALWSASAGVRSLMTALNITYDEQERRGFLRFYASGLLLTLGAIIFAIVSLALVAALPPMLDRLAVPAWLATVLALGRWVILGAAFVFGLAVLYRYGPSRREPQWRWVSWGAVAATVLWIFGSVLFSLYVSNFGDYNKTYGALAAVVILLTWFYLTAFVVLFGAELNAEMEHQTRIDSTTGEPKPMGRRGAQMADSVGSSR